MHRLILIRLLAYRNKNGQCNPSRDNLADEVGVDRRTVMRAVAVAIERGWLAKPAERGGRGIHNNFVFTFPPRTTKGGTAAPVYKPQKGGMAAPVSDTKRGAAQSRKGGSPVPKGGQSFLEATDIAGENAPNGNKNGKGNGKSTLITPKLDRKRAPKKRAPAGAKTSMSDAAAAFNQVHPRPVR